MSQRYVCPSLGTIGRPFSQRIATGSRCSRGLHASASRFADQPGDSAPQSTSLKDAMTGNLASRQPRRQRNVNAATQIGNLSFSRPPPANTVLAKRTAPGPSTGPKVIAPRKPIVRKEGIGAAGTMARAPSTLRITREGGPPDRRPRGGPNLRARGGGPLGANQARGPAKNRGSEGGPANRERGGAASSRDAPKLDQEVLEPGAIEGSMMQTLYRMQRNQWDRKPYEPKYAPGSFAANELIHAGRELFKGEAPPVKVWGKLERTLNIVGMHGAASTLKVRRVLDGDDMPFGQEHENLLPESLQSTSGTAEQKAQQVVA